MHPAPSIILFTTLSGLGFGLMIWMGLGFPGVTGWTAFAFAALACGLAGGGLVASTFHLRHPERALKAFSQWRSSWLSREGVLSVATLAAFAPYAAELWLYDMRLAGLGWLVAALALATVLATSMIYAQIRAVPRWHHWTTPALFVLHALAGGALLAAQTYVAALLLLALGGVQIYHWRKGDIRFREAGTTAETATGLGRMGRVRLLEPPHTGRNYLLREMVHVVGRRHAERLRLISLAAGCLLPAFLLSALPSGHLAAGIAVLLHLGGVLAGRWLFFAEAEHVVGLYYGRR
ncbi:dibenzothiophene desulfurase [Maritimibacter sp. 55A14]|uniref:dimethyl sulfoxide reductase anchor subunit family protein n=1 Tax=Maritimibacter sp. 55A14 TaxID=2174844 RepID=UPI000D6135D0|nr:DmsC/YnfH family molybdoenzyme membrane anchor subunit [Maritimibacter sp. 55A14]PWE33844.1 dibenzothiophene desulfurase [Maritimibacter sp. 55A14]